MSDQLSFHNPYHFVPVEKPENRDHWLDVEKQFRSRQLNHYGHDCYHPYTYSGRIVCCLTTESPIVIGGERVEPANKNEPATVKPFELTPGQPAIPASSLRGLLSSLAEAASNSALRVLDDKVLSYRKAMNESLSALGMVVIDKVKDEKGNPIYRLKPLALPTLRKNGKDYTYNEEEKAYTRMFGKPAQNLERLKVYVSYSDHGNFLAGKKTFSQTHSEYYYARRQDFIDEKSRKKDEKSRKSVILGKKISKGANILSENVLSNQGKADYIRGILRILGKRGQDMPNKKHEFFIPYPEEAEKWPDFLILPEAIERFEQLADERTKAEENPPLPYEPLGTKRNEDHEKLGEKLRLKEGDIVYFRPTLKDGKAVVAEIAFSSIWRGRVESQREVESQGEPAFVEAATVHDFFKEIDPELLPFHKDRKCISPAELLFGFVQKDNKDGKTGDARRAKDNKDGKTGDTVRTKDNKDERISDAGRALAGRVQVSFGQLAQKESSPYGDNVLLKSLLSPKLPCPAMYFKNRNGNKKYIKKSDLNLGKNCPQGRKMYLHHPDNEKKEENQKTQITRNDKVRGHWESRDAENKETRKLKSFATPIRKELQFYFHLDFNNLDKWELGLLFYALRPYAEFRHKLGMGKAIGLGRVRIDPVGVFLIDRDQRYRVDDIFQGQRYHKVWADEEQKWPEHYQREKEATQSQQVAKLTPHCWEYLRKDFIDTMIPAIKKAVELLGNPAKVAAVVHTPQIFTSRDKEDNPLPRVNEAEMERESFRWFVANEKEPHQQMLTPLGKSDKLPTLKRIKGK